LHLDARSSNQLRLLGGGLARPQLTPEQPRRVRMRAWAALQGSERTAVVVMVATETEREASWSRLDGLLLHWGCSTAQVCRKALEAEAW